MQDLIKKEIVLSRKNIFKRDNYTCQYCGIESNQLTIDHVVPRQKGGTRYLGKFSYCVREM